MKFMVGGRDETTPTLVPLVRDLRREAENVKSPSPRKRTFDDEGRGWRPNIEAIEGGICALGSPKEGREWCPRLQIVTYRPIYANLRNLRQFTHSKSKRAEESTFSGSLSLASS